MAAAAPIASPDNAQHAGRRGARGQKSVQPLRAGEGHSFFWRKLHSLTGIVPIGAFLVEHIISNFETWNGPLAYAQQGDHLTAARDAKAACLHRRRIGLAGIVIQHQAAAQFGRIFTLDIIQPGV